MVNISSGKNLAEFISIPQAKAENSCLTHLVYMTCRATSGNGVRTIGWMIILPLQETTVFIKIKTVATASPVVDRGMIRLNFVAAQPGCEFYKQMLMSLW